MRVIGAYAFRVGVRVFVFFQEPLFWSGVRLLCVGLWTRKRPVFVYLDGFCFLKVIIQLRVAIRLLVPSEIPGFRV